MMTDDMMVRLQVQALLDAYVSAIDDDRLEEWPTFFTEDCLYEIIPKENADADLPVGVMRCENRRMISDRVTSLRHANIFAPATYRHFLSGLVVTRAEKDEIEFTCNYLVINSNQLGQSFVYQTGCYHDRIVWAGDCWLFARKRAIFDTSRVQTLLAIPV
jgi:anthranilate 1,2-dioxygenase small subunit